jgi:uncharacterized protein YgiM (DUF1202 family)
MLKSKFCRILSLLFCALYLDFKICWAGEIFPFQGKVNSNNINIRSDSTTNSQIVHTINKGEQVDVILELYEWYKIRLPKKSPAYIKKALTACVNYSQEANSRCQNAKVLKKRVNIRLQPNESSPILGRVNKDQIINILDDCGSWYKIEPVENSFGWIHKRFVDKVDTGLNTGTQ